MSDDRTPHIDSDLPRAKIEMPPGAAVPSAAPPQIPARDVLNQISNRIAQQSVALMNAGMEPEWLVALHLEHMAGILALYEPRNRRRAEVNAAIERLRSLVDQKVLKRRARDQENGIKQGGMRT